MMLRPFIFTLLLTAQFLFLGNPSSAQSSMPSSSCPCTLRGSVVDSASGQPVPHALVKLTAPSPHAALTDSAGKFQFEGLPAGSATLEASKPGFPGNDGQGSWSSNTSSYKLEPDAPPAVLKLLPEGIISGQISDENGEPLEGFTIMVFPRGSGHSGLGLGPEMLHRPAVTDDQGKFRIAGLHPGSYYLAVRRLSEAPSSSRQSAAPMGYPAVFYPNGADVSSAAPLKVLPGTSIQANFSLKRAHFIRLSGTVSGYSPQESVFLILQDSSGIPQRSQVPFDPASGSFQTQWVPPGSYVLAAQSLVATSVDASRTLSSAVQRVNAVSSLSNLHLALQPTIDIPVNAHGLLASNAETGQPQPFLAVLVSQDGGPFRSAPYASLENPQEPIASGATRMLFRGVASGTYKLLIGPEPNAAYYAESATWGSVNLLRDDLVIDSSGTVTPIDLVLREDGATLRGKVLSNKTALAAQVCLLSGDRRPISLGVGPNRTFEISGVPPGVYTVFATDSSSDFEQGDNAFLSRISSKTKEITLSPKQTASIDLELATVEE